MGQLTQTPSAPGGFLATGRNHAERIATTLGDTSSEAIDDIGKILLVLGAKRTADLVELAIEADASGGMWYRKAKYRRTLSGCFFRLVRDMMTPDERNKAFRGGQGHCPPPPPPKPLRWPQRLELLRAAERQDVTHGKAVTVKINIVGKPQSIISQDPSGAVLVLFPDVGPSSLPKGVPQPESRTQYAVYIGAKQWKKISKNLRDPNDALVIEGYPTFDKAFQGITVLAQNTSTKKLRAEQLKRIGEG